VFNRLVAKAANLRFLWSGVTEKPQPKAARDFFAAFFEFFLLCGFRSYHTKNEQRACGLCGRRFACHT